MKPTILATIAYPVDSRDLLVHMGIKGRDIGKGCWFGYGGKIEPGEDADACIIREFEVESGGAKILKKDLRRFALIDFYNDAKEVRPLGSPTFRVLCYRVLRWKGIIAETPEMQDPQPFPILGLPWSNMKPGDELFVPHIILGVPIKGWIRFDDDRVITSEIKPCILADLVL